VKATPLVQQGATNVCPTTPPAPAIRKLPLVGAVVVSIGLSGGQVLEGSVVEGGVVGLLVVKGLAVVVPISVVVGGRLLMTGVPLVL